MGLNALLCSFHHGVIDLDKRVWHDIDKFWTGYFLFSVSLWDATQTNENTQGFSELENLNSMMKMDRTMNDMYGNVWNWCSARMNPKYKILQFLDLVQSCKFAAEMRRTQSACPCLQDSSSPRTWKIVCMASNHTPNQGSRKCGAYLIQNYFLRKHMFCKENKMFAKKVCLVQKRHF